MEVSWKSLYEQVCACQKCGLCSGRTHTVFGEGAQNAEVMFVGEGPGFNEDQSGRPFVGAAGQLLDKMLAAIELSRAENAYICNIVKCRPPNNRAPEESEAQACLPYLRAQFALIRPKIIVCLGATAAKYVYDPNARITRDRGAWKQSKGVWIMPTFHPAALLRDPVKKYDVWEDLKRVREMRLKLKEEGEASS